MGEAHAITNKQVEELWALVEADETAGKSNSEMYDSMVQKLGEYGVSAEKATQILEQYGAQAGVSSAFVEEMTGKVQALGKGFSESSSTIDTSSITVKESIKGIRSVLYDLSVSSSEYAGTYRGVLEVFNNTSGSAANAQDAFNIVYNALKEAGVPLDELNKKLAQEFPSAAQATKSSVDSSIVEAQKTISSSTGKMKTDAETNLAGVKKAAEDASGGVNTTTVTNWGNSASEVKKNLDKMKQTANLKLGEMQKTVESHFSGQYNTMTKKWEKACERISSYKSGNGQSYRKFYMNRDGFSLLAMGFTGREALEWKLQYIRAFNQMENFIREKSTQMWIETRKAGKLTRKAETDTIQKLVEYAKGQGSSHAEMLYMT